MISLKKPSPSPSPGSSPSLSNPTNNNNNNNNNNSTTNPSTSNSSSGGGNGRKEIAIPVGSAHMDSQDNGDSKRKGMPPDFTSYHPPFCSSFRLFPLLYFLQKAQTEDNQVPVLLPVLHDPRLLLVEDIPLPFHSYPNPNILFPHPLNHTIGAEEIEANNNSNYQYIYR